MQFSICSPNPRTEGGLRPGGNRAFRSVESEPEPKATLAPPLSPMPELPGEELEGHLDSPRVLREAKAWRGGIAGASNLAKVPTLLLRAALDLSELRSLLWLRCRRT